MLVPVFIVPVVVNDLSLDVEGIPLFHILLDQRSLLVPDLHPVPLGSGHFFPVLILVSFRRGKRKGRKENLAFLFIDLRHFADIAHQCGLINSVLHNIDF